ncbi:MAG: hypothetical protein QOI41_6142 [Myxococcales bacterium]|nr:hypothetical protein [Myxococcales bacterium]
MKKLFAFARAVAIIVVAILPGFGAAFTMAAGAPPERPAQPPPVGRVDLVGSYVAMEPGMEEGALTLGFARTTMPLPAGASPALDLQ